VALAQYSELFWFPSGALAANVPARVFLHDTNTLATLYADASGTTPLANPVSTSGTGRLQFWIEEGNYWVHIDSEAIEIAVGAATESATQQDINDAIADEVTRADAAYADLLHAARHAQGAPDPVTLTMAQITDLPAALDELLPLAGGTVTGPLTVDNDLTVTGGTTFDAYPTGPGTAPTAGGQLVDKTYADNKLALTGGTISGNLAVNGHALGVDTPASHGSVAWCYPPALAVNSTAPTNGTLYLVRVNIAANVNVTKLYWWVAITGSGAVAGQNHVGLYDSAGTLLASAGVDSAFASATLKTTTIASQALVGGAFYWVGLLFNASVPPTLTRASGWTGVAEAANVGLSPAAYQFAINGTGRTSLPSSITPASNTGTDFAGPWVAVGA
jgi:hypothetical protein